ncbi:DUF2057 domain-containing protein [Vibrio astriarenae]|uniref:UPF0319 protein GT360_20675 n=1 Tax=Vibrio astriarenae TaxID=1481923 RepID=A0A7Z2T811_9VIBR|nr:DUF2057 family protein [Vibrio astriarenae]QIA65918.1 DUF2057 domain-containing protein [Vibrio astriarenae]
MKRIHSLATIIALSVSAHSMAAVTIEVPETISVLAVNQEKADLSGSLFSSTKTLTLPDGENQVVFRYSPYFDKGDERIIIDSKATIAKFDSSNKELKFDLPTYRHERDAKSKIDSFEWKLVDKSGQAVAVTQDQLIKDGMQIGRDYIREIEDYNRAGGIAAVGVAAAIPTQLPETGAVPAQLPEPVPAQLPENGVSTAEEMLYFWYSKADADAQARFKAYINAQ